MGFDMLMPLYFESVSGELFTTLFYFEMDPDLFGCCTYSLVVRLRLLVVAYFSYVWSRKILVLTCLS